MGDRAIFTRDGAWSGFSYDLSIELGSRDDDRLATALRSLWAFPDVDGCYLDPSREPEDQFRFAPDKFLGLDTPLLRGVAKIDAARPIACSSYIVDEGGGSDWLYFGLPMGSLGRIFPVGAFPFDDGSDMSWRIVVDGWLCQMADYVFNHVPFRLALIGFTEGEVNRAEDLLSEGVPQVRWCGYLVPDNKSLKWYPPTQGAPIRPGRSGQEGH